MKILFLDIDGVLNSRRSQMAFDGYPHSLDAANMAKFDLVAVGLVRRLCRVAQCSVVLSSDWRYDFTANQVATALNLPVIDVTPRALGPRGAEIDAWLKFHPEVTAFAIVDDIAELAGFSDHPANFVRTDDSIGLTLRNYGDLASILNRRVAA